MKTVAGMLFGCCVFFFMACGERSSVPEPVADPLVLGRTVYIKRCVSCHNHDGTGTLRRKPYAADFNQVGGVLAQSDDALVRSVLDGKKGEFGTMPAFRPILKESDIRAALVYIRHTFGPKDNPPVATPDAAATSPDPKRKLK